MFGKLLSFIAILGVLALSFAPQIANVVYAQSSECDDVVVDQAGVFKEKLQQVKDAANKLATQVAADVRVRTFTSVPGANLDAYQKILESKCSSWRAQDGGRKNNLIVVSVSVNDRKTGLYYGSQWTRVLDSNWNRIQADFMNPKFRDGDFGGGTVAGINEVTRVLDLQIHPPTLAPVVQQPPVVIVQPTQPPSPPPDLSGLWTVLGWIVGLIALGAVGLLVLGIVSQYIVEQGKRRAAQQAARLQKQAAASRISAWEQLFNDVQLKVRIAVDQMSDSDTKSLQANLIKAQRIVEIATQNFSDLGESAGDPSRPNLTVEEYEKTERAYQAVVSDLQKAEQLLRETDSQIESLLRLVTDVPKVVAAASANLSDAQKRVHAIQQQGFKTDDAEKMLAKAQTAAAQAEQALKEKQYGNCQSLVRVAVQSAESAAKLAETLPAQQKELRGLASALANRIETVKAAIIAGKAFFDQISAMYAASSWESIQGNGTEATNRVNWSLKALQAAQQAATSFDTGEWKKGNDAAKEANVWLDEAESEMRSISARKKGLEAARRDAPNEIQAAASDITKAREYIARYDADIRESLETDLDGAQQALASAEVELRRDQPDFIKVVKLARQANETADQILVAARSEHEVAERLRQQAASALRDGKRAVSKAKEYIEDHSSDVSRYGKSKLSDAQGDLREAETSTSLNSQIKYGQSAEKLADSAYAKAKSDVNDAEEERRPRYTPSYSRPPSPSRSSGGGGGSSGWGSSSGGGGSSSFGSSSGGGGSSGW
jgi:uncharacterized membrane protein YgcG